ncbi:MAG: uridine kinase [Flavobacteriaceae bacterium]
MLIIGIYGGTGSGKTTIVNMIASHFSSNDIEIISQDSYYKDNSDISYEDRCKLNFDHPDAIDFNLLHKHIKNLRKGETVEQPIYDFKIHNRLKKTIQIKPKKILILEGILIMCHAEIRSIFDLKIFINANSKTRMERRIKRDIAERGRSRDEVLKRYIETLKPMHEKFIEPTKIYANYIIENQFDNKLNIDELLEKMKLYLNEK